MRATIFAVVLLGCASGGSPADRVPDDSLSALNCPKTNVWRHEPGSWLLSNPKIHLVFWSKYWLTSADGIALLAEETQVWNTLAADPVFYSPVYEYGVRLGQLSGTFLSYWDCPDGQLSEDAIRAELLSEIGQSSLPVPDDQSVYVILLPPNTQSWYNTTYHFGGHHNALTYQSDRFAYAVIENGQGDGTISHEIYESCTNPDLSTGWYGAGGENEIADLCSASWQLDSYTLATVWSESKCSCQPQ